MDQMYTMMCELTHPNTNSPHISLQEITNNLMKEQDLFVQSTNFFMKQYWRESSRVARIAQTNHSKLELLLKEHEQLKSYYTAIQQKAKEKIRDLEGQVAERGKQLNESRAMLGRGNQHSSAVDFPRQADRLSNYRHTNQDEQSAPNGSRSSSQLPTNAYEAMVRRNEAKEMETARILNLDRPPILKCLQPRGFGLVEVHSLDRYSIDPRSSSLTYSDPHIHPTRNYGNQPDPRQNPRPSSGNTFIF
jgi:hypothetical protein